MSRLLCSTAGLSWFALADMQNFSSSFLTYAVLWPPTRLQGFANIERPFYEQTVRWAGTKSWKKISGITKDSAGVALDGVTVKAYRVTDGENRLKDQQEGTIVVSSGAGAYEVMVPTTDTYYCVGYIAGAPDRAGTTVNTLVGT